jgi:hypothetical protein
MNTYAKTNVVNISRELPVVNTPSDLAFLYIPVNAMGMAVEPKRAVRLECWKHTNERRKILYVADSLKYAMVRKAEDEHVHLLSHAFTLMEPNGVQWLTEIHRHVSGDIHLPKFKFIPPVQQSKEAV